MKTNDILSTIVEELNELGLREMAAALTSSYAQKDFAEKSKIELLTAMVDAEYQSKLSKRYDGRLRRAGLLGGPQEIGKCVNSEKRRYLPEDIPQILATLAFVKEDLNVCILGPSDSGKTYLARAIGIKACMEYSVAYYHCENFLEEMVALKHSNYDKYQKKIRHITKLDLLILDDFLLHTITDEREIKVLFEVMEKRSELMRSTIICSQREPSSWASMILNDEVSSNAIMKRATKHYTIIIESR